ncbi:MAG: DUF3084 domain-containing protein [Kovacikia sp.]
MSTGYILILAVLLLGGFIATVGDRIGTRVGKARLSLFNLRPRKTATLVTILTGTVISASTLGILFAASEYLRTGVFELDNIQKQLRRNRSQLQETTDQKKQVEDELVKAQSDRKSVQRQLSGTKRQLAETDRSLRSAIAGQAQAQAAKARTAEELNRIQSQVRARISELNNEIRQLQTEKNQLNAQKDQEIRAKEVQLKQLESQQEYLTREVRKLEQAAQGLRLGNVAILRGQVLATAVVRITDPASAKQAVDQLLSEANRTAIRLIRPGTNDQIIQITKSEVEQLVDRMSDGQDYVVRIFSAANYLIGEQRIQVFTDAVRNQVVFLAGDVVAATTLDPSKMSDNQIQDRINLLIAAANFRARSLGILNDSVSIGRVQDLITFIDQLRQYNQMVELKAVAADVTSTAGPLKIELIAAQNGTILFRTKKPAPSPVVQ